jgi:hypothetical protein
MLLFRSVNRHEQLQPARLTDKAVALVVTRAAAAVGLDPKFGAGQAHSSQRWQGSTVLAGRPPRHLLEPPGEVKLITVAKAFRDLAVGQRAVVHQFTGAPNELCAAVARR